MIQRMNSTRRTDPLDASKLRHLLYEDEGGKVVGLDEVQLLEPVPAERIPALRTLLVGEDERLRFEAAVVLAAWGDEEGISAIEELIDGRVDARVTISPHRIYGYDNVYDELAQATHRYGLSGGNRSTIKRIYRKLLGLYGPIRFESRLKYALLREEHLTDEFYPDVVAAIERAFNSGEAYLASQLLPVAAKWRQDAAMRLIAPFVGRTRQVPDPAANVAEALKYIPSPESRAALVVLATHPDRAVAEEANESIAYQSGTKSA